MLPKRRSTRLSGRQANVIPLIRTVTGQPAFKVQKGKAVPASQSKVQACVDQLRCANNTAAQDSEQEKDRGRYSNTKMVSVDKALLEKLIDAHMLLLRGQQDLKVEIASLKQSGLVREAKEAEQEHGCSNVPAIAIQDKTLLEKLIDGQMQQTQAVRKQEASLDWLSVGQNESKEDLASLTASVIELDRKVERIEALLAAMKHEASLSSRDHATAAADNETYDMRQSIEQISVTAQETKRAVHKIQNLMVTSGELDTLKDNLNSRSGVHYKDNKARLTALDTNLRSVQKTVMDIKCPPNPHRKIVEHVVAALEPKVLEALDRNVDVKQERASLVKNESRESTSGFRMPRPAYKPLKRVT